MTSTSRDDREAEMQRLIHELQVHQLELETQNQALRESQQLLEDSRNRFADLYDFAPIGYCTVDRAGHVRELNLAAATMLGLPRDLLLGRPFVSAALVRDAHAVEAHLARSMAGEARVVSEVRLAQRERAPGIVQLISCPIRDERGAVTACRTALIDVTVAKAAEGRLALLAEAGEVFASSLDHKTTLATVTRLAVPTLADICFVDLLGEDGALERLEAVADPHRVLPVTASRLQDLRPGGAMRAPQQAVIDSGRSIVLSEVPEAIRDRASADEYTLALREAGITSTMIVPLEARDRVFGALTLLSTRHGRRYSDSDRLFAEDIGRRAAMAIDNALLYERTQMAVSARDAVMALVSHDMRNPLAVIRLYAAAGVKALESDALRERARPAFDAILRSVRGMDRLIADLLDVASLDAGRLSILTEPQEVTGLVAEALEEAQPLAVERDIELSPARELDGPVYVSCDRFRILQVLQNLIGNALKFTPPRGRVTVRVDLLDRDVRFSVCDSGPGIPAELQRRVFERFWQAGNGGGRGLGLSIADGIVRAHGGRIWVESVPGAGATFSFTLARHQPRALLEAHDPR